MRGVRSKLVATSQASIYSIGAVARMVSVPAGTIRTWEDRYGLVAPGRSTGGHRLYSRDQIDQLRFIKQKLDGGITPATAHRLLAERLDLPPAAPTTGTAPPRLLILLAERDRYASQLEEYFFRTEGFETVVSFDVEESERKAAELSPHLIVVELLISGGAGPELCRRLKSRAPTPIVAISSLALRDEALGAGAEVFLQKPLEPLQLVSAAKDLLGTSAFLGRRA